MSRNHMPVSAPQAHGCVVRPDCDLTFTRDPEEGLDIQDIASKQATQASYRNNCHLPASDTSQKSTVSLFLTAVLPLYEPWRRRVRRETSIES